MKKIILICILISVLLMVGCENVDVSKVSDEDLERLSDKTVVCNKPYIRVGMECCLDQNGNKICDTDETEQLTKEKQTKKEVPPEQAITDMEETKTKIQQTTTKISELKEKKEFCPSGLKTEDWFNCEEIKTLLENPIQLSISDEELIDCSISNNYGLSNPLIIFTYGCLYPDGNVYFGAEEYCNMQGNKLVPNVRYEAYPSLNEYMLKRFAVEVLNAGCTKINRSAFYIIYSLYQNENLLAERKSNIMEEQYYAEKRVAELNKDWYVFDEEKEMFIYPSKSVVYWLRFFDSDWVRSKIRNTPYNFTLKFCLVDKSNLFPVDCSRLDFDLIYEGLKE